MSASPAPPSNTAQGDSPKASQQRVVSRTRSFHQAFLEAKSGAAQQSDDQKRSLGVTFPELYKKALLRLYATRAPEESDSSASPSAAAGLKGRFAGAAARLKLFAKSLTTTSADASGQESGEGGQERAPGSEEQGEGPASGGDGEGDGDGEAAEEPQEDAAPPAEEPDDPAAAAMAEEFQSLDGGGGSSGGGGMMGQLKGVFDKGGELDNSQAERGGGAGGAAAAVANPNADLMKKLKEQLDGGKDDMEKAMDESFSKFLKKKKKDGAGKDGEEGGGGGGAGGGEGDGGGGGGGGFAAALFANIQKAAAEKLQQAKDASKQKGAKPPKIEIKSENRPKVQGKDPWLPSGLSPRQVELRAKARELVVQQVLPNAAKWDKDKTLPRRYIFAAGRQGMCGMLAPLLAGGRGWSHADAVAVMEVLGAADLNSAAVIAHQNRMAWVVGKFAGPVHKLPLTAALSAGLLVGTLAASEPLARRDKDAHKTLSFGIKYKDMSGDYWILNGYKDFTPLAGQADLYLVAARTDPTPQGVALFLLPKFYPGMFWLGPSHDTLGARSLTHRNLVLACCILRDEMRMAGGEAVKCIREAADRFRLLLASAAVGAAATALVLAHDWLVDPAHRHFSHPLIGYQALEHRVVGLQAKVDSARLLVQHAAAAFDSKAATAPAHAALAKRFAVSTAFSVLEGVRTLFGAASVHVAFPLDRVRRNLVAYQLLGGDMEDCVDLAWSGLVSKRKVKGKKAGGAKKKKGPAALAAAGATKQKKQGQEGEEEGEEEGEGEEEEDEDDDDDEEEDDDDDGGLDE